MESSWTVAMVVSALGVELDEGYYAMAVVNENGRLRVLLGEAEIERRVTELAEQIDRDYGVVDGAPRRAGDPLIVIGVLKGSVFFMVDLLKRVQVPVTVDFFQTSSYGESTVPGEVRIKKDIDLSIRGRDVLLVEDIVDTGHTLRTILALLRFRGAKSVRLCALLDKHAARQVEVPIDYCGFTIDNVFVVGYGLDVAERFRNLPYVGVWEPEAPAVPSPS
jgi:hypoxanthine phosphoribosyltransferase